MTDSRVTRRGGLWPASLLVIVLALTMGGATTQAAGTSRAVAQAGPGAYYLSLGDSLAFGYQPFKPLVTGFGYYDVLAAGLEAINPELTPVNLGCPGETTVTFIKGGCQGAVLVRYTGSQLNAALAFLKAHPGKVSPITIALGATDLLQAVNGVTVTAQITATALQALGTVGVNVGAIFKQLRAAAPTADIVTIDFFDPLTVAPTTTVPVDSVPAITVLNSTIEQAAAKYKIKVANMFTAFNTPPANPLLCNLTWMCSSFKDVDPTVLGYKVMARIFAATLGYAGLAPGPKVTNPEAISSGVAGTNGALTWMWIGDQNATGYDVAVYHYEGHALVIDRTAKVAPGTRGYTFRGAKCGVAYKLKVRSRGTGAPAGFYTPGDGGRIPCSTQ